MNIILITNEIHPMNISNYLQQASSNHPITIDPSWGQGNTTFGGMSAALLLERISQSVPEQHQLRSISINFCGPLTTGQPFELSDQLLRAGKSISHYQGIATQDDNIVTVVNACYGVERDSDIDVAHDPVAPDMTSPGQAMPYLKGITPEFIRHVDLVYLKGQFPFSNSPHNLIRGRMRFKDCPETVSNAHLLALIDTWPPALIQKMARPGPCATVTWNVEMITPLANIEPIAGDDWLYYEVDIRQAHHGYGHTEARISRSDGTVLAVSRQLVSVYDKR